MFVDASAIVAIITREADFVALAQTLNGATERITSPLAIWESAAGISRKTKSPASDELPIVTNFLKRTQIAIEDVDEAIVAAALQAFDIYGRRSGHPAQLNMGDCFAYAFAKSRGMRLLYTGNDFAKTDINGPA